MAWLQAAGRGGTVGIRGLGGGGREGGWVRGNGYGPGRRARRSKARIKRNAGQRQRARRNGEATRRRNATQRNAAAAASCQDGRMAVPANCSRSSQPMDQLWSRRRRRLCRRRNAAL